MTLIALMTWASGDVICAISVISEYLVGALPGLKAMANPTRSSAAEGKGCDRRAPSTPHGMYRVGLALPLQGREHGGPRCPLTTQPWGEPSQRAGGWGAPRPEGQG
jgi:hypothetical protein